MPSISTQKNQSNNLMKLEENAVEENVDGFRMEWCEGKWADIVSCTENRDITQKCHVKQKSMSEVDL